MPFTGFTVTVRKSEAIDLNITIDQAFQFIVSCGVVVPPHQLAEALGDIASRVDTSGPGKAAIVFNAQPFVRSTRVKLVCDLKEAHVVNPQGQEIPSQFSTDHETGDRLLVFEATELPPVGYAVYRIVDGPGRLTDDGVGPGHHDRHSADRAHGDAHVADATIPYRDPGADRGCRSLMEGEAQMGHG